MFSDVYFRCWQATRWVRQTEWRKEITNTKGTSGSHQCQLKPESVKGTSCISFIIQNILNKAIIEVGLKIKINTNVSIEAYTLPSARQSGIIDTFWKEQTTAEMPRANKTITSLVLPELLYKQAHTWHTVWAFVSGFVKRIQHLLCWMYS